MSKEEIKILVTERSYDFIVTWIKENTVLEYSGQSTPDFGFVNDSIYHLIVRSNGFRFSCPYPGDCADSVFLPFTDKTKARLKDLYPKEPGPEHIESFNKVIREKNARIKELEKDPSITKVINMKDKIKRLEQEIGILKPELEKFKTFYNEEKLVKKQWKNKWLAIKNESHWSEQKESELIAVRVESNGKDDTIKELKKEKEYLNNCLGYIYGSVDVVKQQGPPDES